jgi:hypothetical protein
VKQLYALSDSMVKKFEHNHHLHKNMNKWQSVAPTLEEDIKTT